MSDVTSNGSFKKVHDILNDNNEKIVPYIRSGDVGDTFIDIENLQKISREAHSQLKLSTTKLHDIIMARKGKIGGASIITKNEVDFNCNENVIKLSINDFSLLNPYYFVTFFNCKYGLKQVERMSTGNVQPWLSIFQIKKLKIELLSMEFQQIIEKLVLDSERSINEAKKIEKSAQSIFYNAINKYNAEFSSDSITIKKYSDSIAKNNRIDSEFYLPKYDELFNILQYNYTKKLEEIVEIKKSIEPGTEFYKKEGIPFIRVGNLFSDKITNTEIFLEPKDFKNIEDFYPKKDTILLSKDGSVGIAYKVKEDLNIVTSGAILHLKIKDNTVIKPNYLSLVLNSNIVKMQAERDLNGAIIQHWNLSEINNVIIPILNYEIQANISKMIDESWLLRKKSKKLLEIARSAIEIAIEENEEKAIKYIEEKVNERSL